MSKIMIVDDDLNIRALVRVLRQNGGFDSCEADDGRNALRQAVFNHSLPERRVGYSSITQTLE